MTLHPRPRLSLHMMVLNGAAVVERTIRPLLDVVDQVCLVDTGSTDGTLEVVDELVGDEGLKSISFDTDGDNYFRDEASSFRRLVPGIHTGQFLLRDWSYPRNLGLGLCTGQYVLKLDADDECLDPGKISQALDYLDANPEVDFLACPYEVMDPATKRVDHVTMYTRIWRNKPEIRFREVCHENVDYLRKPDGSNWRLVGGLRFRDWRDSPGEGVRVEHRNYKILLREHERLEDAGEEPGSHLLAYLAEEAIRVDPQFSYELAGRLWTRPGLCEGDRAWILTIQGESAERLGMDEDALSHYSTAAALGSLRAALLREMHLYRVKMSLTADGQGSGIEESRLGRWTPQLRSALIVNRDVYYPRGARLAEIEEAEQMLRR